MLASTPDEHGPRAPRGAAHARGRSRAGGGVGALLGWVIERPPRVARVSRARARGCCGHGSAARARLAGARPRDAAGARAAGGIRLLVRALDPVVDRARPLL